MSSRVTGRAHRYLRLLDEFGFLDEETLAVLLIESAWEANAEERVEPQGVRRAAARRIFRREGGALRGARAADWSLLFS